MLKCAVQVMRWRDTRAHRPAICTRNRCTHYVQFNEQPLLAEASTILDRSLSHTYINTSYSCHRSTRGRLNVSTGGIIHNINYCICTLRGWGCRRGDIQPPVTLTSTYAALRYYGNYETFVTMVTIRRTFSFFQIKTVGCDFYWSISFLYKICLFLLTREHTCKLLWLPYL